MTESSHLHELPFGLEPADLLRHLYIVGGGPWRLELQLEIALKLIQKGYGVCVLDMDGIASKHLLDAMSPNWIVDTLYWDFHDRKRHAALNLLEHIHADDRALIATTLVTAFQGLFGTDAVGHRSAYILSGAVLALMEVPGTTIYHVRDLLTNEQYRSYIRERTKGREAKAFWRFIAPFEKKPREWADITAALLNKLGAVFLSFRVCNVFAQPKSTIDFTYLMQARKAVFVNMAEQALGRRQAALVGNLLLTQLQLASRRRLAMPDEEREDFFVIIPDCHLYSPDTILPLLSDTTSNLGVIIGNQTVGKRREEFSHCGSFLAMKCGADDVDLVVSELADVRFDERKVMEGMARANRPVFGRTYDTACDEFSPPFHSGAKPLAYISYGKRDSIIRHSRERYCRSRSRVERQLSRFAREWEAS